MARDRELPTISSASTMGRAQLRHVARHHCSMLLVVLVKDMAGLADLYAVGVVGAIATNLGATATDRKLTIKSWERTLMFATFIVMFAIEMSLLIDKPNARYFAVTILAVGLICAASSGTPHEKGSTRARTTSDSADNCLTGIGGGSSSPLPAGRGGLDVSTLSAESILCAIRGTGRTLDFALREARQTGLGFICCLCASNRS